MKAKHIMTRIDQLLILANESPCPRRKFASMLIDPSTNVVISDGYNGGPRGGSALCGGDVCERERLGIKSGTRLEIGCHHSEANAITNAARRGASTLGSWILVTGEPCLVCSKLIHHAGISRVVCVRGGYLGAGEGIEYLRKNRVGIEFVAGPPDPRDESGKKHAAKVAKKGLNSGRLFCSLDPVLSRALRGGSLSEVREWLVMRINSGRFGRFRRGRSRFSSE